MSEEIWIVRGSKPVVWQIPVYITWTEKSPEGSLFPAVPLLRIQQKAFDDLIAPLARKVNGMWMIIVSELRKVAKPATPGTNPEMLIVWERHRIAQTAPFRAEKRDERDAFLDAMYLDGAGTSRDEIAHWWFLFCNHALDWVINKERPVDMFFLKLTPLPFRGNWLECTERWRRQKTKARKSPGNIERLKTRFIGSGMTGINLDGTIVRHIAVEHLPLWWKTIKRVEITRLQRLKSNRYALAVFDSIVAAAPAAIRIYRNWLAQKRIVPAMYINSRHPSKCRIMPDPRHERSGTPTWGTSDKYRNAVRLFHPEKYAKYVRMSRALSKKNGKLPAMPDIRQEGQDVRDGGKADELRG